MVVYYDAKVFTKEIKSELVNRPSGGKTLSFSRGIIFLDFG